MRRRTYRRVGCLSCAFHGGCGSISAVWAWALGLQRAFGRGACPDGHYRSSPIVWYCGGAEAQARVALCQTRPNTSIYIPAGVADFGVQVVAQTDVDLVVYDNELQRPVVTFDDGIAKNPGRLGTYSIAGGGRIQIAFYGDVHQFPIKENITTKGVIPTPVSVVLQNHARVFSVLQVAYSYSSQDPCPPTPEGCTKYSVDVARSVVLPWSRWAQSHFDSASQAWGLLSSPHPGGFVPWVAWSCVWESWPEAPTNADWPSTFAFLDTDLNEALSEAEFGLGFGLYRWATPEVSRSLGDWSAAARQRTSEAQAWSSWSRLGRNGGNGSSACISESVWVSSAWQSWKPLAGQLKVPGSDAFAFCDHDGDGCLSDTEFSRCFGSPGSAELYGIGHQLNAAQVLHAETHDGHAPWPTWWLRLLCGGCLLALAACAACAVRILCARRPKERMYRRLPSEDIEDLSSKEHVQREGLVVEPHTCVEDSAHIPSVLTKPILPLMPPISLKRWLPLSSHGVGSSPKATVASNLGVVTTWKSWKLPPAAVAPPAFQSPFYYKPMPVYSKVSSVVASAEGAHENSAQPSEVASQGSPTARLARPRSSGYPLASAASAPQVHPPRSPLVLPPPLEELIPQYAEALRSPRGPKSRGQERPSSEEAARRFREGRQRGKWSKWEDSLRR